jgi:hypothetical protein
LQPKRVCKFVTKLVPQLKPHESCVDVPREVCVRTQTNPRKVQKQIIKKWCYTPSEDLGLDNYNPSTVQDESFERTPPTPQQCPSNCRAVILSGDCNQSCDTYANICGACVPKTTPPPPKCPLKCQDAISTGNCDPTCNIHNKICGECIPAQSEYNLYPEATTTPAQCPSKCKDAILSGSCDTTCNIYERLCGPCIPTSNTPTQLQYIPPHTFEPPPLLKCPSKCKRAIASKICDPSCIIHDNICGQCTSKSSLELALAEGCLVPCVASQQSQ